MPIEKFDVWASRLRHNLPLSTLKDAVLGIDASYYLELALRNNEEYLINAHGGLSFTLERELEDDLKVLRAAGVGAVFVFNGVSHVNKSPSDWQSAQSTQAIENGFIKIRNKDDQSKIAEEFSKAKYPVEILHRYLQQLLVKYDVDFLVAPYAAAAQLAYMLHASEQWIDAVMGSTECFLFSVDKIITKINHGKDITTPSFDWISRASLEERLKAPPELLRDGQLLLGTSFSLPFPPLEAQSFSKLVTIQDAIYMLNSAQRSVLQLCKAYQNNPTVVELDYADRYKKAIMTIRHHIVIEASGSVAPLDLAHAPGDVHDFVGQCLPEELFFYVSRGLIASNIPNWLTQGEIILTLPSGVRDSEPYRRLVFEQLNPIRALATKVIAEQLNFYYQRRNINVRSWDGRNTDSLKIMLKDEPELKTKNSTWAVRGEVLDLVTDGSCRPSLSACLHALDNADFASKTINQTKFAYPAFRTKNEIISNTWWRFLELRGYVNEKREITRWGQVLEATVDKLDVKDDAEGQGLLAVELLRLGLLNGNEADGTTVPTSDKDYDRKTNTNLIAKVACLGKYQNQYGVGYCGTLNKSMLTFAWMVTAVRLALRNLIEAIMVAMFLGGEVERERNDWGELVASLPLVDDHGAALGIMTKTYLDALKDDSTVTPELKDKIKKLEKPYSYFGDLKHGSLTKSLDNAWKVWDATLEGVKRSGLGAKEQKVFAEADAWLGPRR
ncbi:hypothetical protein DV736_g2203, partial [Chaetothyriales sp. CBS 134916]